MKNTLCYWLLSGLIACAGCATGTSGGPGKDSDRQPIVGQADETFRLTTLDTAIRQGETKTVSITIKRALNFDEDVTLHFAALPSGVSVDNRAPLIKHGDSEARFTLTASDDASLGEFSLKVTGHPSRGSDATNQLNLVISKK